MTLYQEPIIKGACKDTRPSDLVVLKRVVNKVYITPLPFPLFLTKALGS